MVEWVLIVIIPRVGSTVFSDDAQHLALYLVKDRCLDVKHVVFCHITGDVVTACT